METREQRLRRLIKEKKKVYRTYKTLLSNTRTGTIESESIKVRIKELIKEISSIEYELKKGMSTNRIKELEDTIKELKEKNRERTYKITTPEKTYIYKGRSIEEAIGKLILDNKNISYKDIDHIIEDIPYECK